MYLDVHGARTTVDALDTYVGLAEDWIDAINNSEDINDCFPFQAEPTREMAERLKKRTDFMRDVIILNIADIRAQI